MAPGPSREAYTVGWICALPVELTAAQILLDEEYESTYSLNERDTNVYTFGKVASHYVVVAALPDGETGTGSAATVAAHLLSSFPSIRVGLMVGIGGGVPGTEDVRLGDVVVSRMEKGYGGVIQYDFGKTRPGEKEYTGFLDAPPAFIRSAVTTLRSNHNRRRTKIPECLQKLRKETDGLFERDQDDRLFESDYNHVAGRDCSGCDLQRLVSRSKRDTYKIHYGTIASGNQVMKSAEERDRISELFKGVLCFEMEAAGLMNSFPCLVIRGISDYADSHKNDGWHGYAAGIAAAYAKDLLLVLPASSVEQAKTVDEATRQRLVYLPMSKNNHFIGREDVLDELEQRLLVEKSCSRLAVVGLGGIGKTQIALRLAYRVLDRYKDHDIYWVSAVSKQTIEQGFSNIAKLLKITPEKDQDMMMMVMRRLDAADAAPWLLIIDNADDPDVLRGSGLDDLPRSGIVLWTTRTLDVAHAVAGSDYCEVETLSQVNGIQLLQKILKQPASELDLVSLLAALEHLPLAITQATAYMNTHKVSISEYLILLKAPRNQEYLLDFAMSDSTRPSRTDNAVAATWIVSFEQILKDEDAAKLLEFMSCVEFRAIPQGILPAFEPRARQATALGVLCSYSFVTHTQRGYDMHRLVHLAARIWYARSGRADMVGAAVCQLYRVLPKCEWETIELWRTVVPHVARLEAEASDGFAAEKGWLCRQIGHYMYLEGRTREQVSWCERAVSCTQTLDSENVARLSAQHDLAFAFRDDGQIKQAVELLEHVVAVQGKVLSEEHPNRLVSQHELAGAYLRAGETTKAVQLLEHVVEMRQALAEDHPSRLASQHTLASTYLAAGETVKAVQLLEHVVETRQALAEDHPARLVSQHELACAYDADGRSKDAVGLLKQVMSIKENVPGVEHPSTLATMQVLGAIYAKQGELQEGLAMMQKCYALGSRLSGVEHPHTQQTHGWLEDIRRCIECGFTNVLDMWQAEEAQQAHAVSGSDASSPESMPDEVDADII